MTDARKEGPSARALKQLTNRNNLADLKLRKVLEQFDREKSFSMASMDRNKHDTRDFLRTVKYCDSDYLPQSRTFLGTPSRRKRSQTARTAPGRIVRGPRDTQLSDDDSEEEDEDEEDTEGRTVITAPILGGGRLLGSRETTNPRRLNEYQRAEKFLRRLREQVAVEELQSHYTDPDHNDFVSAVVTKIQRNVTPSAATPSEVAPDINTICPPLAPQVAKTRQQDEGPARFDLVYPIRLLADVHTKNESTIPTPSPTLGPGSPRVRATPLGVPEGGALGMGPRVVMTAPQPFKPWTTVSLNNFYCRPQSTMNADCIRSMLRSRFKHKPLHERVKDFCAELDQFRSQQSLLIPRSVDTT